jgi:hypothetical protein
MADPLAVTIATAIATRAAETLTEQAQQALASIVRKIRERFASRGSDQAAVLDSVVTEPESAGALATILNQEFSSDPGFRDEIQALWLQVSPVATDDAVANVFYGKAEKVVQLRDVHGDLNIS